MPIEIFTLHRKWGRKEELEIGELARRAQARGREKVEGGSAGEEDRNV